VLLVINYTFCAWAAITAGPLQDFYASMLDRGMKPSMARLTLARKIATITLLIWKKGVCFDAEYLKQQAAERLRRTCCRRFISAMAVIFQRPGSRVSIQKRVRLNKCLAHQVSRLTVCLLGQPEKAIGRESQIEPWLVLATALLAVDSECCEPAERKPPPLPLPTRPGYPFDPQSSAKYFS
jgi:hypothetical protein